METIDWNKDLSVGIDLIDEQHKKLVSMLNDISEAIVMGRGQEVVVGIVHRLRDYAEEHFKTEENEMTRTNYPDRYDHMIEHDLFIEKILDYDKRISQNWTVLALEIQQFIWAWLKKHIQKTDKLMGDYLCACRKGDLQGNSARS